MPSSGEPRGQRGELLRRVGDHVTAIETTTLPGAVRALLSSDLTLQQLKVLTVLATSDAGETVRGLAGRFGVSMPSMSTMLDRLVAQGTARREVDPQDLRVRRTCVTAQGRAVVQRLVGARPEFTDAVLSRLSLADLRALERGMSAVSAALSAAAVDDADTDGAGPTPGGPATTG